MIVLALHPDTYAASKVALEYLAERSSGEVKARFEKAQKDIEQAFKNYCEFESGVVPAMLRRQAT
jgi:hypothetical protein